MLDFLIEIHKNGILYELCLQETLLVNWAVEDALEGQIPEEVCDIVLCEEVLREITCEVR